MLKVIYGMNGMPISLPVSPTDSFMPGQIAQLKTIGNDIVVGLSDGLAPLGIIDDIRSSAFTQPAYDEIVIIPGRDITTDGYYYYNGTDSKQELANAGLVQSSFIADYDGLVLNPINGILTLLAGATLNWDSNGDHKADSVRCVCNYVYQVANLPGDDTTVGSGRITVWVGRGIYATDQYDTRQKYTLNCTLFIGSDGKLTSQQITPNHCGVALCTAPPNSLDATIQFLWL